MTAGLRQALPLMLIAMCLVPTGDAAGRYLGAVHGVEPIFTAWSRFALGMLMLAPFGLSRGALRLLGDWRIWLRAVFLVGGIVSILTALRTEPIADVFGAFFIGPILGYALSAVFLREAVSPARTALLLVGFGGVLLVVKPGFGMTPGLGFAVLAGSFYGGYLTASRWLAGVGRPRELLFTQLLIGALLLLPFGPAHWPPITPSVAGAVLVSALGSALANLLLLSAMALAPASRLAPFVYTQLLAATLLGLLLFDEWPDRGALLGLALILASGLASLMLRERVPPIAPSSPR